MTRLAVVRDLLANPPSRGVNEWGEAMVHMTVKDYEGRLDALVEAATDEPAHVHVVDHETGTGPDHHGVIEITGICACGAVVSVKNDSII